MWEAIYSGNTRLSNIGKDGHGNYEVRLPIQTLLNFVLDGRWQMPISKTQGDDGFNS
jgi:hypothetical protein